MVVVGAVFLFLPELFILTVIAFLVIRKIATNHTAILCVLAITMVGLVLLFPSYLNKTIYSKADAILSALDLLASGYGKQALSILIKAIFYHSALEYLFMIHTSFIIALAFEVVAKRQGKVETFSDIYSGVHEKMNPLENKNSPDSTLMGHNGKVPVFLNDDVRHCFICGTSGSGKTVALANLIESGIKKDYPMVIIDGKGDISEGSILDIVRRFRAERKVYVVNLSNLSETAKYNPFHNGSPTIIKDMIVNMTDWSEEHYKANFERYVQRMLMLMVLKNIPIDFKTIINYFDPDNLKKLATDCVKSNLITKEDEIQTRNIIKTCSEIALSAQARFSTIAEGELGTLFDGDGIDISTAVQENAIFLFVLNPLIFPETTKALGRLALVDAKKAVSTLFTKQKKRVFFIFDEISTYISDVLVDLLNKSRAGNVTCTIATQSLSDLDTASGTSFREQVIENCNTYILLRQNSANNAEEWAKVFGTRDGLSVTYQLGKDKNNMTATGMGSAKKEREFLYHPDVIKRLKTGEAIYMNKDTGKHCKINVRKGF